MRRYHQTTVPETLHRGWPNWARAGREQSGTGFLRHDGVPQIPVGWDSPGGTSQIWAGTASSPQPFFERRAGVYSCCTAAHQQRRNRQRSGKSLCRADAQRRGQMSTAEFGRLEAIGRVFLCPTRRLRRSFLAARQSRTSRCLTVQVLRRQSPDASAPPVTGRVRPNCQKSRNFPGQAQKYL